MSPPLFASKQKAIEIEQSVSFEQSISSKKLEDPFKTEAVLPRSLSHSEIDKAYEELAKMEVDQRSGNTMDEQDIEK